MPPNRLFDQRLLDVLAQPERWRLASTLLAPDIAPVVDAAHDRWRQARQHAHPYVEVMIALAGHGAYGLGDRIYPTAPGTVLVFDPEVPHDDGYPPRAAMVHLWASVVERHAVIHLVRRAPGGADHTTIAQADLDVDLRATIADCRRIAGAAPPLARARLVGAIGAIAQHAAEAGWRDPADDDPAARQAAMIRGVRAHIWERGGRGIRLGDLARVAGYSTFHFLRVFKRHTGKTVHEYVDWCRDKRFERLRRAGRPLKDIAVELGFSCASALSRWRRGRD